MKRPEKLANIHYIRQNEPKGLGHAIWCARKFIGEEPFAVLLGDTILEADPPGLHQMMGCFERYKTSIIGVQGVREEDINKYGVIEAHPIYRELYRVTGLVEKPSRQEAPSHLAIVGRYILTPAIFGILEKQDPGNGNEIQLTDALKKPAAGA